MYAHQVWLNNLTLISLLTINSFPFKRNFHPFNKLIRDNLALWCSSFLIKAASARMYFHSQSPVLPRSAEHIFCDPSFPFFFFFHRGRKRERLLPVFEAMDNRNLHIHTREVGINKMTTQILLDVDVLCTQGPHTSNRLISGNVERIFCDLSFSPFFTGFN